jgi:hypothetical protein
MPAMVWGTRGGVFVLFGVVSRQGDAEETFAVDHVAHHFAVFVFKDE